MRQCLVCKKVCRFFFKAQTLLNVPAFAKSAIILSGECAGQIAHTYVVASKVEFGGARCNRSVNVEVVWILRSLTPSAHRPGASCEIKAAAVTDRLHMLN